MCVGSTPSAPPPPPVQPEAPTTPDASGRASTDADRRRRRTAAGQSQTAGTILTGSRGVQNGGTTGAKTLLGQ